MFEDVGGRRMNIVSFGSGEPPIVLVGGWIGTWQVWRQVMELVSPHRRCIAYDHRGAGQTPAPVESLHADGMVDDVFGVMDSLSIERGVLVGESQGGFLAAMAALRDPSRFVGLGLVDTTPVHQPSEITDQFAAMLDEDPDGPLRPFVELCIPEPGCDHIKRWLLSILRESDPVARPALIRQLYGVDLTERLADIQLPTIVIHGENDAFWPVDAAHTLAAGIPGAELHVIPQAGHVPMMTRPAETADVLLRFVEAIETRGRGVADG